jgi:hypothetical protein
VSFTVKVEIRLKVFGNRVLRRIGEEEKRERRNFRGWTLVNTVMRRWVPYNIGKFLSSFTGDFSKTAYAMELVSTTSIYFYIKIFK